MKKFLLTFILLFLTGCSCNYEVELSSKHVKESIKFDVENADLYDYNEDASIGDDASSLIENNIYAIINDNDAIYDKNINDIAGGKEVTLKYTFKPDDYKNYGRVLNTCFENVDFNYEDGTYKVKLSGYFYCLYGDEVNIKVKSNNFFKTANGKKDGTNYTWTIDKSNYENVDISFEISDKSKVRNYIYIIIAIVFGIVVLIGLVYFIGNFMGRNNVNDI